MNIIKDYTIGADPECFIYNSKTKSIVSSVGMIPGEKGNPFRDKKMPEGFGLETDNILAEFNIPPVNNLQDWLKNMEYMKTYIKNFVKKVNPDYTILCKASAIVDKSQLNSEQANEFGCMPDYNAYTEAENVKPECNKIAGLRSAGFHIHVGYPNFTVNQSLRMIKYMDAYIGIPSVLYDKDTNRRILYGKAGSFRLTDYGFEYRTLSSEFLKSKATLTWVWEHLETALNREMDCSEIPDPIDVQNAINNSDVKLAKKLIDLYNLDEHYTGENF